MYAFARVLICAVLGSQVGAGIAAAGEPSKASAGDAASAVQQIARGQREFRAHCAANCHQSDLAGGNLAPPLAGDAFLAHWNGVTVDGLFIKVKETMPQTKPQSLDDQAYIDIVAFLLDANGIPAGKQELRTNLDSLRSIVIGASGMPQ
jgi:S-disulfanyl-L-cysteine oxidoreductase SoxD